MASPFYGRFTAEIPTHEPPMDWKDWLDVSTDLLHDAQYKAETQRERLELLQQAEESIKEAKALLQGSVRFVGGGE